ncbi:MAG: hypothetical protein GY811_24015 [Myxococcales bacterium]|nr:hypothetical protein [Myxococcales bacterium]
MAENSDSGDAPELSGPETAALVLLSLDEETAASVMRFMTEDDLVLLAKVVDALDPIPYDSLGPALRTFERRLQEPVVSGKGGEYMRKLAETALGADKAGRLFAPPEPPPPTAMKRLHHARTSLLADLLVEEHPQVAAVITSQLPAGQASKVLREMPEGFQLEIIARIAGLEEIPRDALEVASEAVVRGLDAAGGAQGADRRSNFDGVAYCASLLNELPSDDTERILEELEENDFEQVPKIREAMFTFEDLSNLDKRSLQTLMREISSEALLTSLRTASEAVRDVFFSAVSSRAAETMREDLELMPPKRLSEVEEAQREVIETAMRMSSEGQITMPGGGGEEMV